MLNKSSGSVRIYYPLFSRTQLIQRLREELKLLEKRLPLSLVVLFGSYAKGNYTTASDVDLIVVYEGEERGDAFAVVKKTLSISSLEPHVYSVCQYEELKESIHKMIEDGIVLFSDGKQAGVTDEKSN